MKTKISLLLIAVVVAAVAGLSCHSVVSPAHAAKPLYYACPMHPDRKYDKPGSCPICGMDLKPVYAPESAPATNP